jgi:phage-related protein
MLSAFFLWVMIFLTAGNLGSDICVVSATGTVSTCAKQLNVVINAKIIRKKYFKK